MSNSAPNIVPNTKAQPTRAKRTRGRGAGRPTDFHDEMIAEAHTMAKMGAIDTEIADHLGVSLSTYYLWKNQHPKFSEAVQSGKALWDDRIEQSLARKAAGYSYDDQEVVKVKTGQHEEAVEVVDVRRYVPPDTAAAIFWLKNRDPNRWKDRQQLDVEHSGAIEHKSDDARALAMATLALLTQAAGNAPEPLTIEGNTDDQDSITPPPEGADDPREPAPGYGGGQVYDDFLEP